VDSKYLVTKSQLKRLVIKAKDEVDPKSPVAFESAVGGKDNWKDKYLEDEFDEAFEMTKLHLQQATAEAMGNAQKITDRKIQKKIMESLQLVYNLVTSWT